MAVKRPPHCTSCGLKSCWRWTIAFKKWVCNISCRGLCNKCRSKKISDASKKVSSSAKRKAGSLGGRRKIGKSEAGALGGQSQSRNKCLATRCNLAYGRLKRRWGSKQGKKVDLSFHEFLIAQDAIDRKKAKAESTGKLALTPTDLKQIDECKNAQKAAQLRTMLRRRKVLRLYLTLNPILRFAFLERIDKKRDFVDKEMALHSSSLRRVQKGVLSYAVRFTQSARGVCGDLADACKRDRFAEHILAMRAGSQTYTGVLPRSLLARIAEPVVRKICQKQLYESHEDLQRKLMTETKVAIYKLAFKFGFRKYAKEYAFHCGVVADDFLSLGVVKARCEQVCLRTGSRKGLAEIGEDNLTLAVLAAREGRTQSVIQTSLCAYGKYCRMYRQGIRRWYVKPGDFRSKNGFRGVKKAMLKK